ncbi:transposase, partial [Psychroflexus planctonicus]|uniref:transposase n=1 Tax=Psychroflexus planctonicus TaxID=1526575 RepID=UPI0016663026
EKEIKLDIVEYVKSDDELKEQIHKISTIPGIGELTATIILAETNGFELIRNKRQLTSYAGLDVKEKLSGTSVKGKPKISKRGNRYLRKAVYFPALTAIRHNQFHSETFVRLVGRHGIKMKALVAIQRKLLELVYILYKNNTVYDSKYEEKKKALLENAKPLESSLC